MAFLSRVFADAAVFKSTVKLSCIQRLSIPATHIKNGAGSSKLTPATDEILTPRELEVAEAVLSRMKASNQSLEVSPGTPEPEPVVLRPRKWTRISRRTGVLSRKLGMTQLWKKDGTSVAVTVLQVRVQRSYSSVWLWYGGIYRTDVLPPSLKFFPCSVYKSINQSINVCSSSSMGVLSV